MGGVLLGGGAASFARRNLGLGSPPEPSAGVLPPRSTTVDGEITTADGPAVSLALRALESSTERRVLVVRRRYPAGRALASAVSDPVTVDDSGEPARVEVSVPRETRSPEPWFYEAYVREDGGGHAFLAESAPVRWTPSRAGDTSAPARRVASARPSTDGPEFERSLAGNDYHLTFRWRDSTGDRWTLDYPVRRSTYEAGVAAEHGYVTTYEASLASPLARDVAGAIARDARRVDHADEDDAVTGESAPPATVASLDPARRFDVLMRFVQDLRFAHDSETLGVYDYNRTVAETLVAGVGDCQERTYLLAGLLAAAFDCRTALLFQVGHVLLGVPPDDVPALPDDVTTIEADGREYVPIEPSLEVPVGTYPPHPVIGVYGDDRWLSHDLARVVRGVELRLRNALASLVNPF